MDTNTDYSSFDESISFINNKNYQEKYNEALNRSIQRKKRIREREIKIRKRNKALRSSALATVIAISVVVGAPKVNHQLLVNKAIDYQKQQIAMMMNEGNQNYTEEQMLGLMDMLGDEKGIEMATNQNWQDYCRDNGYTEVTYVSDGGNYSTREPSIRVLKNYLEEEAIKRMKENTDENGDFVFPNLHDGGKQR